MSGVLRPWLLDLGNRGLFRPIWSDRIGLEWRSNAARIWNIAPALLEQEWDDMQRQFVAANVSRWSAATQVQCPALKYSDVKDWHVIDAAWLAKQAQPDAPVGIVTLNIKDFSRSELRQMGLDLWDPDRLLSKWYGDHSRALTDSLQHTLEQLITQGRRHRAGMGDFLKRERLFRLNKLMTADTAPLKQRP